MAATFEAAPRAIQNPAYRPADTLSTGLELRAAARKSLPRLLFVNHKSFSWSRCAQHCPYSPASLTPILSHDIPNHPVNDASRGGAGIREGKRRIPSTCRGAD